MSSSFAFCVLMSFWSKKKKKSIWQVQHVSLCLPADEEGSRHVVVNCSEALLKNNTYWPLVSDFINILSHQSVAKKFLEDHSLLMLWMSFVSVFQGKKFLCLCIFRGFNTLVSPWQMLGLGFCWYFRDGGFINCSPYICFGRSFFPFNVKTLNARRLVNGERWACSGGSDCAKLGRDLFIPQLWQHCSFLKVGNVVMPIHLPRVHHGPKNNVVDLSIFLLRQWAQVSPLRCAWVCSTTFIFSSLCKCRLSPGTCICFK